MKLLLRIATALVLTSALHAQEGNGVGFVAPAIPKDPNLAKVAFFRLCYPGGTQSPTISLAWGPRGGKATLIETGLAADTYSDYLPMRPGRFTLHILEGNIPNDATTDVPIDKKLAEPLDANLTPGRFFTIFIAENGGKLTASLLADPPAAGKSPNLRILDISKLGGWSVRLATRQNQPIKTLWKSGEATSGIALPSAGVFYIEVWRTPSGAEPRQMAMFETQLESGTSFSIVLTPGTGEGDARLIFDSAPRSYDPQAVQALVDGVSH